MFETQHGLVKVVRKAIHQTTMSVPLRKQKEKTELVMYVRVHQTGRREVVRRIRQPVQHVRQLIHIRNQNLIWNRVKPDTIRIAIVVRSVRQEVTVMA